VRLLEESVTLRPHVAAAYNLALALDGADRAEEAITVLERLRSGALGVLTDQQRRDVEERVASIRARLGAVEVIVRGGPAEITLDDEPADETASDRTTFRDRRPGDHDLAIRAGDRVDHRVVVVRAGEVVVEEVEIAGGGSDDVAIGLGIAGAVALAAVAGIVAAVLVTSSTAQEPPRDPVFGVVIALAVQ
jgi:hypothetical protein